jgi:hypothetical protein
LAWSPTGCLIETRVSQPQPLLGTLDLVVIMTDEDKTETEPPDHLRCISLRSRPSQGS